MGKITNVLNKVQESRREHMDQKSADFFYTKNPEPINSKMFMMVTFIVAIIIAAVSVSHKINNLEMSLKLQEKRVNDLTVLALNTKSLSSSQMQDVDFRLNNEAEDRKIQINNMALVDNTYYINIVKSILADAHRIDYLEKYTKNLKNEIDKAALPAGQSKDLKSPANL
jgi:hypothetical protein